MSALAQQDRAPCGTLTGLNPGTGQGSARARLDARSVTLLATLFKGFFDNFYNVDVLGPDRISDHAWQSSFTVAVGSSPYATYACVDTWLTDFREDLPKIVDRSG
jgi:non-heme chloroperoxidase